MGLKTLATPVSSGQAREASGSLCGPERSSKPNLRKLRWSPSQMLSLVPDLPGFPGPCSVPGLLWPQRPDSMWICTPESRPGPEWSSGGVCSQRITGTSLGSPTKYGSLPEAKRRNYKIHGLCLCTLQLFTINYLYLFKIVKKNYFQSTLST